MSSLNIYSYDGPFFEIAPPLKNLKRGPAVAGLKIFTSCPVITMTNTNNRSDAEPYGLWEARVAQAVSALCLSPLKPCLVWYFMRVEFP